MRPGQKLEIHWKVLKTLKDPERSVNKDASTMRHISEWLLSYFGFVSCYVGVPHKKSIAGTKTRACVVQKTPNTQQTETNQDKSGDGKPAQVGSPSQYSSFWFVHPVILGFFFPQLVALLPPVFPKGVADQRRPYNWTSPRHAGRPLHQQQQQRHARLPGAAQLWQSVQQPQVQRERRWKAKGTIGSQSNTAHVAFSLHWTILLAITQVFLSFQKLSAAANIFLAGWRSFEWRRSKLALRCKFLQIVRIKWWCNYTS